MHDSSALSNAEVSSIKDTSSCQDKKSDLLRQMTVMLLFSLELEVEIRNAKKLTEAGNRRQEARDKKQRRNGAEEVG